MREYPKSPFRKTSLLLQSTRAFLRFVRKARLKLLLGKRLKLGPKVFFGKGADIRVTQFFTTGDKVSFGKNFTCEVNSSIGSNVLISSNVAFISRDHNFSDPALTVFDGGRNDTHEITVGDDVLIGFGAIIIAPVTIETGCIIGAGSVVSKDLPGNTVCAGVPARAIKARFSEG